MPTSTTPQPRKSAPYSRVRRRRTVRRATPTRGNRRIAGSSDPIAGLGDRVDERGVAELGPQPADGDLDGLGERVGALVPDPLQQLLGRNRPAGGGEQDL